MNRPWCHGQMRELGRIAPRAGGAESRAMVALKTVMHMRAVVRSAHKRSWKKRASWRLWCTIGPQINHEAQILHEIVKTIVLVNEILFLVEWMSVESS